MIGRPGFARSGCCAGFAFIFGNSIKNLFEAVLFLFVQHPFDVGDIVVLESGERVQVSSIQHCYITGQEWRLLLAKVVKSN